MLRADFRGLVRLPLCSNDINTTGTSPAGCEPHGAVGAGGPPAPPGICTGFALCSGRTNGHQQLQAHPSWMYLASGSEVIAGLAPLALLFPDHTQTLSGFHSLVVDRAGPQGRLGHRAGSVRYAAVTLGTPSFWAVTCPQLVPSPLWLVSSLALVHWNNWSSVSPACGINPHICELGHL